MFPLVTVNSYCLETPVNGTVVYGLVVTIEVLVVLCLYMEHDKYFYMQVSNL
jgi:hypothetical protein